MSHSSKLVLTALAAGVLFGCKVASKANGSHAGTAKDAGRPYAIAKDSGSSGSSNTSGQDAATDATAHAMPDATGPGNQMPSSMLPTAMDGGPLVLVMPDATAPMMMSDAGSSQAQTLLRMVSVPPSYTLAGEAFDYTPKLNQGGEATLRLVSGPSGMSFDSGRLTWVPDNAAAGDNMVDMEAALQDAKLSQKFDVHVGIATQLAQDDLAASKMGQVVVDAPLSPIQGAAITVPAGALSQTTTISISELDRAPSFPNVQGVLKPVKFGPSGLGFLKPATIALPYDKAGVTDADKLAAYVYDQDHSRWVSVPVIGVDEDNALLLAKASHFSIYAAGATSIDSTLALARMSAASICQGDVVGRLQVTSGWDAVEVTSINNRSSLIDDTLVPAGATSVQLLLQNSAFVGTLRAVSVLDLFSGDDPDRIALGERVLVTSVYVPGDGTALVRHTDALGNLIGERSYTDFSASFSNVAARLAGAATQARFGVHPESSLALAARMHLLYAEGDATLEPVAIADLGVSLVDRAAGAPSDPATADDALDVDCDRLLGAYDAIDDSQKPVVTADPDGVGTVMAGDSLRLRATIDHASDTPVTSWDASDPAATLTEVSPSERDFSSNVPGRYLVSFSAQTSGTQLSHVFAIDVIARPAVNTPPSCTPSASSGLITFGDVVALSAVVADAESPQGALSIQWGLVDRSGSTPVLMPSAAIATSNAGFGAAFTAPAEGSFEIGCVASDGSLSSSIGSTSVSVLAANANIPPENLALSPAAATLVLGDSLKLKASASDRDGDALQFGWSGSSDLGTPLSTASDSSVVFTPSSVGQFTLSVSVTDTHSAPLVANASILVVSAPLSLVDADGDGFPPGNGPGLDCNDHDPNINPAAKEICGNSSDENCDGIVAIDDCDGDGYSVQQGDCNDANRYIHPGAVEACDGIDNDCDNQIDNGFAVGAACTVGVGACQSAGVNRCSADGSFVTCFAVPKAPVAEICDGLDNNCNGLVDENGVCNPTCSGGQTFDVERRICVCPPGQLWDGQQCGQACPSGQVPVYGSQTCRALMAGDTCANAIDFGTGGVQSGTLAGRGVDLPGCWSSTTSLRVFSVTVQTTTQLFTTASGNITASIFQGSCGGQPMQQCAQPGSGHADKVAPGTYYIVLGGEGSYSLTVAEPNGSGGCSVPDGDGDGFTMCAGDCDDTNAAVHPGAAEVCDGVDNDCNGMVDDFAGSCSTGLPGICATGRPGCGPNGAVCTAIVTPGQVGEICGDGHDNNCDGQTDEPSCSQPLPGQTCSSPLPGGYGGTFNGTFATLEPVLSSCAQPGDGHALIHIDVPTDGLELGVNAPPNVQMSLYQNDCNGMAIIPCGKNFWHQQLPHGGYLLELTGQGAYGVAIGLRDPQSGLCLTPDGDSDGVTICNGDCNDNDASVHPGAVEVCDGIDNDCAGGIDDLRGTCATGLPGACAAGQPVCAQGGGTSCNVVMTAGQEPEYCGDGIDNNCDSRVDEAGCVSVAPGEICSLPIDLGVGGNFSGDLTGATDDVGGTCSNGMSMADHVYRLTVPSGAPYIADFQLSGQVIASVLSGGCGTGYTATTCFDGKMGSTNPNQSGPMGFEYQFAPGVYYIVIEGTGVYQLGMSLRNSQTGTCLTPDGDGDGFAICSGDCNDQDPSVHPGAQEICNGRDDDCNGAIDDVQSNCGTGLPGACQMGKTVCVQNGSQCMPFVTPGQHPEYCADGIDNDCNGQTDEPGCTQLPPGETCALAIDVGQGGSFAGDLTGASDDVPSFCGGPAQGTGDRIYHLVLNQNAMVTSFVSGQGVTTSIFASLCGDPGSLRGCLGSPGGTSPTGPSSGMRNDWMSPGDYFFVLDGTGPYALSLGIADTNGNCLRPDADGDGYTLCNGDCDDSDSSVHPGAVEVCDQRDNDCDGFIDDPHQTCTTGLPGACNAGDMQCVSGMAQCKPRVTPGQLVEYCSDGVDNDCNGQTDEAGCTAVAAGEICSLPIDVGQGGTFTGDLSHATDDVNYTCDGGMPMPDHVYALHIPMDAMYSARLLLSGVASGSLFHGGCGDPATLQSCFGSSNGGSAPMQDFFLSSGDYAIVVEGNGPYALGVGLRANGSTQCLTPDGDSDGYSLCDGDCDDRDPARHPGVTEVCDGVDNDCNGMIDDVQGTCSTGLPGACATGKATCSAGAPQCALNLVPGQLPEYCGDQVDNDCNGLTDEAGCTAVQPGEVCWLPIDIGEGGHFTGDLSTHTHDVNAGCWGNEPDMVYALTVPAGASWQVNAAIQGAGVAVLDGDCNHPNTLNCFGPPPSTGGDAPDGGVPTGGGSDGGVPFDGGIQDGGGAPSDGGFDAGVPPDGGSFDGGSFDGGSFDAGVPPDGGSFDGGMPPPDGGSTAQNNWNFNQPFGPGKHMFMVQGPGAYAFDVVITDANNGNCITPDSDGDGIDVCHGDCNDHNASIHPGAPEICDGIDNDCDGVVDDPHGMCSTGQPGVCAQGHEACNGLQLACVPLRGPAPEICGDGIDNDCNGLTDETGCTARESCADAEDVGPGGTFYGNLDTATSDVPSACSMSGQGDHVYRIQLPPSPSAFGTVNVTGNVEVSLFQGSCGGAAYDCSNMDRSFGWGSGSLFYVVVKGSGNYALSLAIDDGGPGQCSVPDLDGDGHTICDRDCDEGNPAVWSGAPEICDGLDNNCDGVVDNLQGSCATGLPGACGQGTASCNAGTQVCTPNVPPGSIPDYCGDGIDNDCDGTVDGPSCTQVQPGEVCSLAIDMGPGGSFSGDLSGYTLDVQAGGCSVSHDVVYMLNVPADGHHFASVRATASNGYLAVFSGQGSCGTGMGSCFIPGSQVSLGSAGGTYYFVVSGNGSYTISAAITDLSNNSCSVPDHDSDGFTLCDGDCNDADQATHPGALELCDGIDNDCNGPIDDLKGNCPTGLPGACAFGTPYCSAGTQQCNVQLTPGQKPDYCGDGIDNDCDGTTDGPSCVAVAPGEVCSLAIDLGQGGTFQADLASNTSDVTGTCGGQGMPDLVYKLSVPQGSGYEARFQLDSPSAQATLLNGPCDSGFISACFAPPGFQYDQLAPGNYEVVVTGSTVFRLSVGLRDSTTGVCLTPDGDGDGITICDNDCDDQNPGIYPGRPEICGDGKDNDCDGVIDNGCPPPP